MLLIHSCVSNVAAGEDGADFNYFIYYGNTFNNSLFVDIYIFFIAVGFH